MDEWNELTSEFPEDNLEPADAALIPPRVNQSLPDEWRNEPNYYLMRVPRKTKGKFAVGDRVRIIYGLRGMIGEIMEDCGNIGINAMRVYGVKVRMDEWNEVTTPISEDNLEPVDEAEPSAKRKPSSNEKTSANANVNNTWKGQPHDPAFCTRLPHPLDFFFPFKLISVHDRVIDMDFFRVLAAYSGPRMSSTVGFVCG